jgi:hypothetical protein
VSATIDSVGGALSLLFDWLGSDNEEPVPDVFELLGEPEPEEPEPDVVDAEGEEV